MDVRPSFRRRRDLCRLLVALGTPWAIGGTALLLTVVGRWLYRSGGWAAWLDPLFIAAFYGLLFAALLWIPAAWLFGVWRRSYRRSLYGWLWLAFCYANLCGAVPFLGCVMEQ